MFPAERAVRVGRLVALCALLGVVAGFGAVAFEALTGLLRHVLLDGVAGYRPAGPAGDVELFHTTARPFTPWLLALLPVAGGLVGGAIVVWLAPEAEGHGTDAAIEAYHQHRGEIRGRVPLVKMIASAITLGTGGSAGREGPIAQIGAGFGSFMAHRLRLGVQERRVLMVAGLAGGIGAIFRAPLASALFAAEVLYREVDMEFEVIVPGVICSIVAYSVFITVFGAAPLFATPHFTFDNPAELLPYTVLAFVVSVGAKIFVRGFYGVRDVFRRIRIPRVLKPALGGAVVGAVALFAPQSLGSSYGVVQEAFSGAVPAATLLGIAAAKVVTTSFTVGSGQSGGVFGPAVVIGGLLGGFVGQMANRYVPGISAAPGAFVIVGMAGFFASAANTPISTIIMVSEMTGSYDLLVPTMWVSMIAFLLVRRTSLYEKQAARRADSPVHAGEMIGAVLNHLTVEDALSESGSEPPVTVRPDTPLQMLVGLFADTRHDCFPIVDAKGHLVGVVAASALRQAVAALDLLAGAVVAADLVEPSPTIVPSDSLQTAMHKMVAEGFEELPVVSEEEPGKVLAMLSRRVLVAAYDQHIQTYLRDWHPPPSARSR